MPSGSAKREVPRWKQKKQPPGPVIMVKGRGARRWQRDLRASARAQAAAAPKAPPHGPLHQSGLYRLRYHLVPVWWLLWVLTAGLGAHRGHVPFVALTTGCGSAALTILGARGLSPFGRHMSVALAIFTAVWVPVLGLAGWHAPIPPLLLLTWAAVAGMQAHHYRIPAEPAAETDDYERWNLLAAERKWNGHLGSREALPGNGRRYPVQLDGIKTTISNVLSASENVAGAWHKPMTEAYVERDPTGITSRGYLTVIGTETLMKVREWNGAGIDPPTGTAIIARYADGSPARIKLITPRYGTRHGLLSGTTGSGKSELLNLLVFIALASGYFVPVILDPQEGQSLPFWRDRCLYAAGVDQCQAMLRGLHAGMLDRSRYLSGLRWNDDGISMRGMPFFDHALTGLPVPLIIFDEAHMLLSGRGKAVEANVRKVMEIGRLGRKTGTALWLATHLPSLSDLGGEQALRDMLRGGNVISMRTANRVASGMLGLEKDPSEIPMFFTDGKETYGLGYVAGPDNRPDAPMRTDLVPKAMRRKPPTVPALDDRFAEAMAREMNPPVASIPAPAALAPLQNMDGDEVMAGVLTVAKAMDGTCADTVLLVLAGEMDRGEIIAAVIDLCKTSARKPYSLRAITDALAQLTEQGKARKVRHGRYAPVRPALHAVPASASE